MKKFTPQIYRIQNGNVYMTDGSEKCIASTEREDGFWATCQHECCSVTSDAFAEEGESGDHDYFGPYATKEEATT